MPDGSYSRRISPGEARQGFVFVLKDWLSFFPPVGQCFLMKHGDTVRKAGVEAVPCLCRGVDNPHEHYQIRWRGLAAGDVVTIERDASDAHRYVMTVNPA